MAEEQQAVQTQEPQATQVLPTKLATPVQLRVDTLPDRQYTALNLGDPLPAPLLERIGQVTISAEQKAIMISPVPDDEIDILPDSGLIYVSHEYVRRQLNAAFGPLGWTMIEVSPFRPGPSKGRQEWYQKWAMLIGGCLAGVSMSAATYDDNSKRGNLADTWETIKSDCIRRICKDLGLGLEAWNRRRAQAWRSEFAVEVSVTRRNETVKMWRRKDADPLAGEVSRAPVKPPAAIRPVPSRAPQAAPKPAAPPVTVVPDPAPPPATGPKPASKSHTDWLKDWLGQYAGSREELLKLVYGVEEIEQIVDDGSLAAKARAFLAKIKEHPDYVPRT